MARCRWPPHKEPAIGDPYTPAEVLEYLAFCHSEVDARMATVDLDAPSGFHWLPFGKLELQLYSIRHLQQHIGELGERLAAHGNIEIDWVGKGPS